MGDLAAPGLSFRSLSTPPLQGLRSRPPASVIYELSAQLGGGMAEPLDLLYLALGPRTNEPEGSVGIPPASAVEGAPDTVLSFEELGMTRTATGWHRPLGAPWARSRLRFVPILDGPALHLRYVLPAGTFAPDTLISVDDLTLRLAATPELAVTLGPEERRP